MDYQDKLLLETMICYNNSRDDFWVNYKENVIDCDNIMELVMDYIPVIRHRIKIALIGVGGVGKTTFLKRLSDNKFNRSYHATTGYSIIEIVRENITYEFYDFAGQEMYCGTYNNPEFLEIFDCIFVMVDKNSRSTQKHGRDWVRRINIYNKPVLKIRNKCESDSEFEFHSNDGYVNISTKTGQGIEEVLKKIIIN